MQINKPQCRNFLSVVFLLGTMIVWHCAISANAASAQEDPVTNQCNFIPLSQEGLSFPVVDTAIFNDGSGPTLYAATSGGVHKWDGTQWTRLPPVNQNFGFKANALKVFNDRSGTALYVGGSMSFEDNINGIAKWDGQNWLPVGSGFFESFAQVFALEIFDDGTGPALYAGGNFDSLGFPDGRRVNGIAKWNGFSWQPVGDGGLDVGVSGNVTALLASQDETGPVLYVGGNFRSANGSTVEGGIPANHIAKWNGTQWSALGNGVMSLLANWFGNGVHDLAVFDDGDGPALYAAGFFHCAGGEPGVGCTKESEHRVNHLAKWDGLAWSALPQPITDASILDALEVFDDGQGPALFVGGNDQLATGNFVLGSIGKWDGESWSSLGDGIEGGNVDLGSPPGVDSLSTLDDGFGPALFVGGKISSADGIPIRNIVKWDCIHGAFIRGDANTDDIVDIADVLYLLFSLLVDGREFACPDAADANDSGEINIADPITLLKALFLNTEEIPPPYPLVGIDTTPDALSCGEQQAICGDGILHADEVCEGLVPYGEWHMPPAGGQGGYAQICPQQFNCQNVGFSINMNRLPQNTWVDNEDVSVVGSQWNMNVTCKKGKVFQWYGPQRCERGFPICRGGGPGTPSCVMSCSDFQGSSMGAELTFICADN